MDAHSYQGSSINTISIRLCEDTREEINQLGMP